MNELKANLPGTMDPRDLPEILSEQKYYPELDYEARGYMPFGTRTPSAIPGGPDTVTGPAEHFCTRCQKYYISLAQKNIFKPADYKDNGWPIICKGDRSDILKEYPPEKVEEYVQAGLIPDTAADRDYFLVSMSPIEWARVELGLHLDWYQQEMLLCTAQWKAVRGGRRIGKSTDLEVEVLFSMFTKDGKDKDRYEILIVCPYEVQVKKLFDDLMIFINRSPKLRAALKRNSKSPWEIEFHNGAVCRGFSSGKKTGARSDKIRSQGAEKLYFDETDFMADEDIETILGVMASQKDTTVWMSTTPTGARTKFWKLCTDKKMRFKEFHYISAESPRWSDIAERQFKALYSPGGFMREFLAEFGTPTEGVFNQKKLDQSVRDYEYSSMKRVPHFKYVLGVDWNKITGTHMIVLERGFKEIGDGKQDVFYRVMDKIIVRRQEFLHHETIQTLLQLDAKWRPDFIYVDQGYGEVQVENLYREDINHPELNLRFTERLHAIHGNQTVVLKDPRNPGVEIKKAAKPFMVDLLASWVDANKIFFPEEENTYTPLVESEIPFLNIGLVQQMREFRVEKYSPMGQPRYSQGYEHTLMALCFAVLGMALRFSEISEQNVDGSIHYSPTPLGTPKPSGLTEGDQATQQQNMAALNKLHQSTMPARTVDTRGREDIGIFTGSVSDFMDIMNGKKPAGRLPYHSPRFAPARRTIP